MFTKSLLDQMGRAYFIPVVRSLQVFGEKSEETMRLENLDRICYIECLPHLTKSQHTAPLFAKPKDPSHYHFQQVWENSVPHTQEACQSHECRSCAVSCTLDSHMLTCRRLLQEKHLNLSEADSASPLVAHLRLCGRKHCSRRRCKHHIAGPQHCSPNWQCPPPFLASTQYCQPHRVKNRKTNLKIKRFRM